MTDRFSQEQRALNAASELMLQAKEVARLFKLAGMTLPERIARMVGEDEPNGKPRRLMAAFVPEMPNDMPSEWKDDWIWIPVDAVSTITLALAVLRSEEQALAPREVVKRVQRYRKDQNVHSVYNVAVSLVRSGKITKDEAGWKLVRSTDAPVIHGRNAWGPPSSFAKADLAQHRRILVADLLRQNTDGLMVMQILRMLQDSGACRAPLSKELIQDDVTNMKNEKAKRIGNSRKWTLMKEHK